MCDGEKADSELIARMFALLTAKFEDAAAIAACYQATESIADERREALSVLASLNEEVATLIAATRRVLTR